MTAPGSPSLPAFLCARRIFGKVDPTKSYDLSYDLSPLSYDHRYDTFSMGRFASPDFAIQFGYRAVGYRTSFCGIIDLDPVFTYRGTFADTEDSFSVQAQAIQNMRSGSTNGCQKSAPFQHYHL